MNENRPESWHHLIKTPEENMLDMLCGYFNDSELSKDQMMKICFDCLEVADCSDSFMRIAGYFSDYDEMALAKNTFERAEEILLQSPYYNFMPYEYIYLAKAIFDDYQDFSWGMRLFEKAIRMTKQKPFSELYRSIANTYFEDIGDRSKATEYYELAELHSVMPNDYQFLASAVYEYLGDSLWYKKLIDKANRFPDIRSNN